MKRLVVSIGVLTLLGAVAGAGASDAGSGAGPPNDFVLASFEATNTAFFVNGWSGPAGESPQGRLRLAFLKAKLDCVVVHEREALVIADIPRQFFLIVLILRDNHPGTDELVLLRAEQGTWDGTCPSFEGTDGRPGTAVAGDINVHDG